MSAPLIGEHLGPGQLGHFFVITSFVASLFSAFSYFSAVRTEVSDSGSSRSWRLLGRGGFLVHSFSVVGIFAALYYIIANHLFEYHYAWEHSSLSLPPRFLLSCFWEGQEGSFMLWTFWHCVLGIIVMNTSRELETRTMTIISLVQVFLGTMILGFYFGGDIKVGSTPFQLLKYAMQGAPIFQSANYMDFIHDGNGLNVLLQNYWMVIHPPVLFLGFATTLIPFAYCVAALWKGEYQSFVRPAIAWSLFNGAVLGTGIMMGGAWAYESLNFGGYWAWDPVENASLVPWLTLVGGLHTLVVYRSTGRALSATLMLLILTHLLVWYSTFLTRTGILGKTSVHAFTGDGQALYYHLLVVIGLLLILTLSLFVVRWKKIPAIRTEEQVLSREFWMFIGAIVLFLSSLQIILTTSIPVWAPLGKWITGKDFAPPTDPMLFYNGIQVWVAVVIGLLTATGLFLKFKNTSPAALWKPLAVTATVAGILTVGIALGQDIRRWQYIFMLFAACYGLAGSFYYAFFVLRGKILKLGPSLAHLGFAAVLLGILLSSYNKHAISLSTTGVALDLGKNSAAENAKESNENEVLFRGVPVAMSNYWVTYVGDSDVAGKDRRIYYKVRFEKRDSATRKVTEQFMLYPDAFINPKGQQGLSANPSTKHYWDFDIFTFINEATDKSKTDTSSYRDHIVRHAGDTIFVSNGFLVFGGFNKDVQDARYKPEPGDLPVRAILKAYDQNGPEKDLGPLYILRNKEYVTYLDDTLESMGLFVRFGGLNVQHPDSVSADIMVRQTNPMDDFIVLKALVFPYINVLWLGVIIMVIGFLISLVHLVLKR